MVAVREFGTFDGQRVDQFTLEGETGVEVDIITWGAVVRDWRVPVGTGRRHVVLGFDTFDPYPAHSQYFGAIAGRVANRISGASFEVDGEHFALDANWHGHTLHGGRESMGRSMWQGEADDTTNSVRLTHVSRDGHMGFPGTVTASVTYTLTGNRLRLDFAATADRTTPISLAQHNYFNLGTGPDILSHKFRLAASAYTQPSDMLIPTGAILPVAGTPYDFRAPRTMRDDRLRPQHYDLNLVLDTGRDLAEPVAVVTSPDEAMTLKLWTDRPGLQLYNAVYTNVPVPGIAGRFYGVHSGFCLEDQLFPDALHNPHFPSILHGPGRDYAHWCEIEIG